MPAGILIINDSNTVLIDENYANMSVLSSGTVELQDEYSTEEQTFSVLLPFTPLPGEKVAIHSTVYATVIGGIVYGSGVGTVTWYRFGPPTSAGTFGLQVFNAAGVLTFDSGRKYARVAGALIGNLLSPPTGTYQTGRTYAVIHARRGIRSQRRLYTDFGVEYRARTFYSSASRQNGVTIEFSQVATGTDRAAVSDWSSNQIDTYVIDVTGY